jgi:hypothetical protein
VRPLTATFALSALAAMTAALAQQPSPPPSTDTPAPAQYPNSTAPPSDPRSDSSTDSSQAGKAALMKRCMAQVQASNPGVPENDVKNFCAKEVYRPPPQ